MNWCSLALASVVAETVDAEIERRWAGREPCHIVPSVSLRDELIREGRLAVHVMDLIDMIACPDKRSGYPEPQIPSKAGDVIDAANKWRNSYESVGAKFSAMDRLAKTIEASSRMDECLRKAIMQSRSAVYQARRDLDLAGLKLDDLDPKSAIGRGVLEVLREAERSSPCDVYLKNLWMDRDAYAQDPGRQRVVQDALTHVFGNPRTANSWLLVVQGFHFYTAPQWQLFQVLMRTPRTEGVFLVHAERGCPLAETWRKHYIRDLGMPEVEYVESGEAPEAALMLRSALLGKSVKWVDSVKLKQYGDDRALMSDLASKGTECVIVAPDADEATRLYRRFSGGSQRGVVGLAHTFAGLFLMRLHECVREDGAVCVSREALRDIVVSGWVGSSVLVVRKAWSYLDGCEVWTREQWECKWKELEQGLGEADRICARQVEGGALGRMQSTGKNALRLASWLDISIEEFRELVKAWEQIVAWVNAISKNARLMEHAGGILGMLEKADAKARQRVEGALRRIRGRLQALAQASEAVNIADLQELVAVLVGEEKDSGDEHRPIKTLQWLAVLARKPAQKDVHVLHLADRLFPAHAQVLPWPFSRVDFRGDDERVQMSLRLLRLREETSAIGDVYLLSLALGASSPSVTTTLSYTERSSGVDMGPSAPLLLLAEAAQAQKSQKPALAKVLAGLPVAVGAGQAGGCARLIEPLKPEGGHDLIVSAVLQHAPSQLFWAEMYCPRRAALQWLVGCSPSFLDAHTHHMLYGGVYVWLEKVGKKDSAAAKALAEPLWGFMTKLEKDVAEKRLPRKRGQGWVFTLGRLEDASVAPGSVDVENAKRSIGEVRWRDSFLPHPPAEAACEVCPVRARCRDAKSSSKSGRVANKAQRR